MVLEYIYNFKFSIISLSLHQTLIQHLTIVSDTEYGAKNTRVNKTANQQIKNSTITHLLKHCQKRETLRS